MSTIKNVYEYIRPLIIWLGLLELTCLGYWLLGGQEVSTGFKVIAGGWIAAMLVVLVVIIRLAKAGVYWKYTHKRSNLLGLATVVLISIVFFSSTETARDGVRMAVNQVPDVELIAFHVLRLLAIGTVIKYLQKELPLHFIVLGTVPDLLFALSAVVLLATDAGASLSDSFFIAWHGVGIAVFLGAGISMFFSVPSNMRIFHDKPDTSIVFLFPMSLAPNYTVPFFMLAHMFAIVKLVA